MVGGIIQGAVSSITEGGSALVHSVKHAVQGEWSKAGENFARAGLEVGGMAASAVVGPGAEVGQEAIEGALDNAVLERGTGDVPSPRGTDWSFENLMNGAVDGASNSALGVFGGMAGGAGSLGKVLGAASGGQGGGGLKGMVGSVAGDETGGGLSAKLGAVGEGTKKVHDMQGTAQRANRRVESSSV